MWLQFRVLTEKNKHISSARACVIMAAQAAARLMILDPMVACVATDATVTDRRQPIGKRLCRV